jgi:predicted dehydrogenase
VTAALSPSPPIQLGILGVSDYLARNALPSLLATPAVQIAAIAARNSASALAKLTNPVAREVDEIISLDDCLKLDEVEAVYITLPNGLHIEWIMRSLLAGKHVLCEKPIASQTAQLAEAFALAKERSLVLREGQMFRYHPLWTKTQEVVMSGALGTPALAEAHYAYLDSDFSGPRFSRDLDGGAFNMIGTYPIATTLLFFRERPLRVTAFGRYLPEFGTDKSLGAVLEFQTGYGIIATSVEAFDTQSFRLIGSRASLECSWPFNPTPEQVSVLEFSELAGTSIPLDVVPGDQFALQFAHFAAEIREGIPAIVTPDDSLGVTAVMEAVSRSAANGGVVIDVPRSP